MRISGLGSRAAPYRQDPGRAAPSPLRSSPAKREGPATVGPFSAVGYFFGRDLHKARKVPIGLIQCAWGGTAAERWTRKEVFDQYPELKGGQATAEVTLLQGTTFKKLVEKLD